MNTELIAELKEILYHVEKYSAGNKWVAEGKLKRLIERYEVAK